MLPIPDAIGRRTSFTVEQGRLAGLNDRQMRRAVWSSAGRGLRIRAGHDIPPAELAELLTGVTRAVVSHETAAALWNFPVTIRAGVHLLVPLGEPRVRRPGVVIHQATLLRGETVPTATGPRTSRVRTWLDLAEHRSVESLVIIGDHLVRVPRYELEGRSEPFATSSDLHEAVLCHPRKRGVVAARTALSLIRVGADSPQETRLRLRLQAAGLPPFDVNRAIHAPDGRALHQPDLSNATYRIAVEYEGGHHGGVEQMQRDIRRTRQAVEAGWIEVRISSTDLLGAGVPAVRAVRQALVLRGWRA